MSRFSSEEEKTEYNIALSKALDGDDEHFRRVLNPDKDITLIIEYSNTLKKVEKHNEKMFLSKGTPEHNIYKNMAKVQYEDLLYVLKGLKYFYYIYQVIIDNIKSRLTEMEAKLASQMYNIIKEYANDFMKNSFHEHFHEYVHIYSLKKSDRDVFRIKQLHELLNTEHTEFLNNISLFCKTCDKFQNILRKYSIAVEEESVENLIAERGKLSSCDSAYHLYCEAYNIICPEKEDNDEPEAVEEREEKREERSEQKSEQRSERGEQRSSPSSSSRGNGSSVASAPQAPHNSSRNKKLLNEILKELEIEKKNIKHPSPFAKRKRTFYIKTEHVTIPNITEKL